MTKNKKNLMGMKREVYAIAESKNDYGKIFEEYVSDNYNLELSKDPTDKWDAFTKDGIPVSIKTVNMKNELIMSCILRQAEVNRDFFLCIGFWEEVEHNITEVYVIKVTKEFWRSLFDKDLVEQFRRMLEIDRKTKKNSKDIPGFDYKLHSNYWSRHYNKLTKKWRDNGYTILTPRSRKNSNSVSNRIQCAISSSDLREKVINSKLLKVTKCKAPTLNEYVNHSTEWLCNKMFERNFELKNGRYILSQKTKSYFNENIYRDIIEEQKRARNVGFSDIDFINNPFNL